jgi:hypothetical protein
MGLDEDANMVPASTHLTPHASLFGIERNETVSSATARVTDRVRAAATPRPFDARAAHSVWHAGPNQCHGAATMASGSALLSAALAAPFARSAT